MQSDVIARLDRVTKTYEKVTALDELSLELRRGELLALLGPNGAGKTTAVRLLLGLSSATEGSVSVFGGDPREERFRTRTGSMLQIATVPETLRVREHIELFSAYYDDPLPLAVVLRASGLSGLQHRLFRQLSGGEKQRVLFALAICGNPDLLILDEPTVGLDVESRRALWKEIERFRAGGRTVVLTTHYLQEADALADRIVVIDHGRIAAEGTPEQIRRHALGRRIRFRSAAGEERLRELGAVATAGGAWELITDEPEAALRRLFASIADVADLEVTSAGLEEAFIAITRQEERVA